MDDSFKRAAAAAALSAVMGLAGYFYSGLNSRLASLESDSRLPAVIVETAVAKTEITQMKQTLERLEDKIDWLIRTENEMHRMADEPR